MPLLHLNVRGRRTADRRRRSSTAESHLGASSLVTAHSAREGRVCWLKRFGPSKVVTEAGLSGLGLPPRALSSIRRMASAAVLWGARGKEKVARSSSTQALSHRD